MHFHVKSVEVLEKLLHPVNDDDVISPPLVELDEQVRPVLLLELIDHVVCQVVFNRLRVLTIQDALGMFVLKGTQVEHNPVKGKKMSQLIQNILQCHLRVVLHVLLLREYNFVVARQEEVLQLVDCSFLYYFVAFLYDLFD